MRAHATYPYLMWLSRFTEHSRVDAVVAGAYAHAVDAADLADVVEVHCSKTERKKTFSENEVIEITRTEQSPSTKPANL